LSQFERACWIIEPKETFIFDFQLVDHRQEFCDVAILDIEIDAGAVANRFQERTQSWNALPCEARVESGTGIEPINLYRGQLSQAAPAVGGPTNRFVMKDVEHAIPAGSDVHLNDVGALRECRFRGGELVLGGRTVGATVRDDQELGVWMSNRPCCRGG